MKPLAMFVLAAALTVGCGKNNEENNVNNSTANNVNNSTANNVNNMTTNNVNNVTTNNINNITTPTNNSNNSNNNNTTPTNNYTAHDFTCDNLVTPAGAVADLAGTYDINAGCVGENGFALLGQLCPDGVLTTYENDNWAGRLIVNDDGTFVAAISSAFSAEIYAPAACVTALGGGTCDGLATFVDGAAPGISTTCVDDAIAGDCYCTLTGPGGLRRTGVLTDGANPGEATMQFLSQQADDSFMAVSQNWQFQTDGTTAIVRNADSTTTYTGALNATDASACETFCHGFLALCQEAPGVTAFADTTACVTACMGWAAGTPGDTAGDTRDCRIYHLGVASDPSDPTNPEVHCQHAQDVPTAACVN